MQPRARAAVIFDRVEQRATRALLDARANVTAAFCPAASPPRSPAIVLRECFARLRFSRAWLSGMHPVSGSVAGPAFVSFIFVYAGSWTIQSCVMLFEAVFLFLPLIKLLVL